MSAGGEFFEQFIDDYFAECEEHLVAVRRILLRLERSHGVLDAPDAQELARALHTIKGLSGMVGLVPAETIAHAMEDAVGAIGERAEPPVIELLFAGAALLDDRIQAKKHGHPVEDATDYVDRVRLLRAGRADAAPAAPPAPFAAREFRVTFVPSAELAGRGVTIDAVRARLAAAGEIVSAAPRVSPAGGVYFEFVVRLGGGVQLDDAWRDDGMSWLETAAEAASVVKYETPRSADPPHVGAAAAAPANLVRVDLARLDESMRLIGELVIARGRLQDAIDRAAGTVGDAALESILAAAETMERQIRALREGIMRIRLVPIGEVFERMRFAMRDIAREHGKLIQLDFEGGDTELDKVVIDRIVEPLMHLVRNAASHGIEGPAAREAFGKSPTGHLMLRAHAAGDRIIVEIQDDGSGIDLARVEQRAHERGLLPAGAPLDPSAVLEVISSPGFSTADAADHARGRGVGMAVVVSTIRGLGGELTVHSRAGEGTRFVIELPLTLMITEALLVLVGGQTMAVPQILLREIVPLADHPVTPLENNRVISYRDTVLPLVDLREVFNVPHPVAAQHVLVVGNDLTQQGLVVDRVLDLREIVVQPVSDPYVSVPGIAGATELADGRISLILDVAAIGRRHRQRGARGRIRSGAPIPVVEART